MLLPMLHLNMLSPDAYCSLLSFPVQVIINLANIALNLGVGADSYTEP